jgi:hypothetical protein
MIHNLSLTSVFIELYLTPEAEKSIAIGTAFTIRGKNDDWFLVTNWHCVSGRHPETNQPLSSSADPESMKVFFHSNSVLGKWEITTIKLYDDKGNKIWIEHPHGSEIDVVAVKIEKPENVNFYNLFDSINGNNLIVEPSDNCSIIGFPKGLSFGGKFPIWKTGQIATDYKIDWNNLPVFYIDASTRKGMSGSPVVSIKDGLCHLEGNSTIDGRFTKFMGIYSGRIDTETEIGRVWKPKVLEEILNYYYEKACVFPLQSDFRYNLVKNKNIL